MFEFEICYRMDLHLRAFWRSTDLDRSFSRDIVLLTGVTGFIGSHIIVKLLLTTEVIVHFWSYPSK